ncbi:ATP-dependent RNA helicase has1-like [Penaeus monodon]|uniref:ATP-dependent RNA helicase has1-like n=1 Tax=Penaeus monodon TaxID=6687 RepID=UPI0018A792FC|nr:ATP-dependent RNA helicase has1-like [Penaeus monodon]XP_037780870.1 ATP-dependent RNA helicase has1-like [Penaeus monodon]XP_037780871.1 ATP-dependent RNA helicase has1-like [Penaeus monodon]
MTKLTEVTKPKKNIGKKKKIKNAGDTAIKTNGIKKKLKKKKLSGTLDGCENGNIQKKKLQKLKTKKNEDDAEALDQQEDQVMDFDEEEECTENAVEEEEVEENNLEEDEDSDEQSKEEEKKKEEGPFQMGKRLFEDLEDLSDMMKEKLKEKGLKTLTKLQEKIIPKILNGEDVHGISLSRTGKTLAFVIPVVEMMNRIADAETGVGAIVVSPSEEQALETHKVFHSFVCDLRIRARLMTSGGRMGIPYNHYALNIIVGTPEQLLEVLPFRQFKMHFLVLDDPDSIPGMGATRMLKQVLNVIPEPKQTLLFSSSSSATLNSIANFTLKANPVENIPSDWQMMEQDESGQQQQALTKPEQVPNSLEQVYIVCPTDKKFQVLFSITLKNRRRKVMVFMRDDKEVEFYGYLFFKLGLPVLYLRESQDEYKQKKSIFMFKNTKFGIMLCTTDIVKGHCFSRVDLVIQYDPPNTISEYCERIGRVSRAPDSSALMLMMKEEKKFVKNLKKQNIKVNKIKVTCLAVEDIQQKIIQLMKENEVLQEKAMDAVPDYIKSSEEFLANTLKNPQKLDRAKVFMSFGLKATMRAQLLKKKREEEEEKAREEHDERSDDRHDGQSGVDGRGGRGGGKTNFDRGGGKGIRRFDYGEEGVKAIRRFDYGKRGGNDGGRPEFRRGGGSRGGRPGFGSRGGRGGGRPDFRSKGGRGARRPDSGKGGSRGGGRGGKQPSFGDKW